MFDSSTDSFGPDAIAVSITEEILSEAQDAPMAIVSSAPQLPLPPPVTAPSAAPAVPAAKPMAPPAAPMSWSSIVTGNQEVSYALLVLQLQVGQDAAMVLCLDGMCIVCK